MTGPLTQAEIEAEIMRLSAELETQTEAFADLAVAAAEAEADYRYAQAQRHIVLADKHPSMSVAHRTRVIDSACIDEMRRHKVAEARADATKQALLSLRARIDATRTLSANVRAQT